MQSHDVCLISTVLPVVTEYTSQQSFYIYSTCQSFSGTRYLRRGVDDHGYVANYVETELVNSLAVTCIVLCLLVPLLFFILFSSLQVLQVSNHVLSYVLVRGSVPVYWIQPGYKYRPPPIVKNS